MSRCFDFAGSNLSVEHIFTMRAKSQINQAEKK
jgi:hypothetical protein